ncbi:MAG: hypothetical protein ABSA64_08195 [Sedimentisphaerales bacterium]|jgi:hypothetical protein
MAKKRSLEYIARLSRVAITLVLSMFAVLVAQVIVVQLVWVYTFKKQPLPALPDSPEWRIQKASKLFLPDGTIHLVNKADTQRNDSYAKEEITDVNELVLWQGIQKDRPSKYLDWASFTQNFGEQQMRYVSQLSPGLPGFIEAPVRVSGEFKEVWRYDSEAKVFAGYEAGGGLIGYLGANGFVVSKAQAKPFGEFKGFTSWTDEDPSSVVMLWQTRHRICQIDFRTRSVEKLFESAQSDIASIKWHNWRPISPKGRDDNDIQYRPLIDCQTSDNNHHLIMREPNQVITMELPEQLQEPNQIFWQWRYKSDFTATSNAIFLQYNETNFNPPKSQKLMGQYRREYDSKPQPQSIQLYKVIDDGKLELVNRFDWTRPVVQTSRALNPEYIFQKWINKVSPPVFDLLWALYGDSLDKFRIEGTGMMQGYATIITGFRPLHSSLNYVLSVMMMTFALWHGWARRTSWVKLVSWLFIVGLFNLAGLLTYLALNHTPVIKCPACGKKRGLEMDNCVQCGSPLPIPQRKPTDLIMAN